MWILHAGRAVPHTLTASMAAQSAPATTKSCMCNCALQDKVLGVQPEQTLNDGGSATGGTVQLASGATLPYDWLVVALGASADPRGVPGIKENARPFNSLADAEFVAGRLAAFEARAALGGQQGQATIVVVGAGYAGVELSAVVGERMKGKAAVVLVTPGASILESAPAGQRQAAEEVSAGKAQPAGVVAGCVWCAVRAWRWEFAHSGWHRG